LLWHKFILASRWQAKQLQLLKELSSGKPVLELALLILIRGIGFSTGKPVLEPVLSLLIEKIGFSTPY